MGTSWLLSLAWKILGKQIAPIGDFIYEELKPSVDKTATRWDDAGLEFFHNFTSQNTLTKEALYQAVLVSLKKEVQNSKTKWDDVAYDVVEEAFVAGGLIKARPTLVEETK